MGIFSSGDRCTLSLILCLRGALVFSSYRSAFGGWWWWAGVCGGLRCRGSGLVVGDLAHLPEEV